MSSRYEFDRLGWYNFEWLTQVTMKALFGYAVESWGAHKDQGRDAYSEDDLVSRDRTTRYSGPVIVQAKFVSGANAAGARYHSALHNACKAEAELISGRISHEIWEQPKTYLLFTNCPLTAGDRTEIKGIFSKVLDCNIIAQGASDLSDILDLNSDIARAFPQILTYRNLVSIIEGAQSKTIRERSSAALSGAEQILPVFVPTAAYDRAWNIAKKHSFVVLTGPPEMGKTSIGWMIAMAQLANGWEIIECRQPDDVFTAFDLHAKQLFLADDAFGRTEFSASRGEKWEADLAQILQRVDQNHWLVWTSRKHILERAIGEMDLQGKAQEYPKPAEVLVQADELTTREKALILYRHAASEGLDTEAKAIVKENIYAILYDKHFTPERIRRFVKKSLPELAARQRAGNLSKQEIQVEVEKTLDAYTEMMEKSFTKLSGEQKWILVAILDEDKVRTPQQLEDAFRHLSPIRLGRPFSKLLGELDESFLRVPHKKVYESPWAPRGIDWVHPSYRDLVIEQLSLDSAMRLRYLQLGGTAAIALALSQQGGSRGEREFPLLPDHESWNMLKAATQTAITDGTDQDVEICLTSIEAITPDGERIDNDELTALIDVACRAARDRWDSKSEAIETEMLKRFYAISSRTRSEIPSPQLTSSWETAYDRASTALQSAQTNGELLDGTDVLEWAEMTTTLLENEPRYLRKIGFPGAFSTLAEQIIDVAKAEADIEPEFESARDYSSESDRFGDLAEAANQLSLAFPDHASQWKEIAEMLDRRKGELAQEYERKSNEEYENRNSDEYDEPRGGSELLNISELFTDL